MTLYERSVTLAHRAYKLTLSPLIGRQCRFLPTCSDYAREALITHGPLRGGWLATKRLCSCHPWGRSGYDPVPPRKLKTMSVNKHQFEFSEGAVRVWLDGGIHIKALTEDLHQDPVELSEDEALGLAAALQSLVADSRKGL